MIALGSNHAGYPLKQAVKVHLHDSGVAYRDFGALSADSCDYPDMAVAPCKAVISGQCEKAILFCGTGIGISMAANKLPGIRAAYCSDYLSDKFT